jgi:hypothetical protein
LNLVNVVAHGREKSLYALRIELGPLPFGQQQLGAMRVEFGRPAFVILDVRVAMAHDAAIRRAKRGKSERICRRSGGDPERLHFGLEKLGESLVQPRARRVAVIGGIDVIGRGDRRQHFRANRRGIVEKNRMAAQ